MGRSSSTPKAITLKRRFKPQAVFIEDEETEAKHEFVTAAVPRSVEREINEAMPKALEVAERVAEDEDADPDDVDEAMLNVFLELIDKLIVPVKGKKKLASEVLRDLWKKDALESADVMDYFREIVSKRRPT
jgi:hypothetical protein